MDEVEKAPWLAWAKQVTKRAEAFGELSLAALGHREAQDLVREARARLEAAQQRAQEAQLRLHQALADDAAIVAEGLGLTISRPERSSRGVIVHQGESATWFEPVTEGHVIGWIVHQQRVDGVFASPGQVPIATFEQACRLYGVLL